MNQLLCAAGAQHRLHETPKFSGKLLVGGTRLRVSLGRQGFRAGAAAVGSLHLYPGQSFGRKDFFEFGVLGKLDLGGQISSVRVFQGVFEYLVRSYLAVYQGAGDRPGKAELSLFRGARRRGG